jgi:hypothetical protein
MLRPSAAGFGPAGDGCTDIDDIVNGAWKDVEARDGKSRRVKGRRRSGQYPEQRERHIRPALRNPLTTTGAGMIHRPICWPPSAVDESRRRLSAAFAFGAAGCAQAQRWPERLSSISDDRACPHAWRQDARHCCAAPEDAEPLAAGGLPEDAVAPPAAERPSGVTALPGVEQPSVSPVPLDALPPSDGEFQPGAPVSGAAADSRAALG